MPYKTPPCCNFARTVHLVDLPHVYQFDFDLYRCTCCSRPWVFAWREGASGWEPVTSEDAARMQSLAGDELRRFMRDWAKAFD